MAFAISSAPSASGIDRDKDKDKLEVAPTEPPPPPPAQAPVDTASPASSEGGDIPAPGAVPQDQLVDAVNRAFGSAN